jgi:hypothetical protein
MDSRLMYHTSINNTTESKGGVVGEPWFPSYHTSLQSTEIALENLKKINNKLDDNNIITLAYLANNPYLNDEDRAKFEKELKIKAMKEYEKISTYVNDFIRRNENSSINESECNN